MVTRKSAKKTAPKSRARKAPLTIPSPGAIDDQPTITEETFPVVGIGASAGGLAAFEEFFSGMPKDEDPGMAFVLVQHLAPDHKSILSDLIQRYTNMPVFEVEDGMPVRVNCAYIIPPNRDMAFLNGALQLLEPSKPRGQRLPIDFFFRSLAQDLHEHAIGIVLSGTGSDGTLGVRAIKGECGMVMAQSRESAEFDGMPVSALNTGLVDYEMSPAEMPAQLIAYATHAFVKPPHLDNPSTDKTESALKRIFILLRAQTTHDFSQYKPSTINRRIERRMAVHQIENINNYVKYLQQTPAEIEALFRDFLIGVTSFFRDHDDFQMLEKKVIPRLFEGKSPGTAVRVWSTGCSTGEEAYSLAILLMEHMKTLKQNYSVQVFATDIDSNAIAIARTGLYPASIANDISPERLARFFTPSSDGLSYTIHKSIRDLLVFSEQDLIKDPPFSKLDLISCRNLLIYLGANLQERLIPMFHYSLKDGGTLFLGSSEGIGEFGHLFGVLDRKSKLYNRKADIHGQQGFTAGDSLSFMPPMMAHQATRRGTFAKPTNLGSGKSLRELTEQELLNQFSGVAALVSENGDIFYLHGRSGMYLELPSGEVAAHNILKMAREGLRRPLTSALHKSTTLKEVVSSPDLRIKSNGNFFQVNLSVRPLHNSLDAAVAEAGLMLYLVIFDETPQAELVDSKLSDTDINTADSHDLVLTDTKALITELKKELRNKNEYLQSAHEELETSTEELKSSNEEMQSVNEELQSTNEELETSKEELQSVNEELATVNVELQTKVVDLSQANNDMNNLLAGTGIGTVFVDHQLRILRYTPAASSIINLIPSDVGRPVSHIVSNLNNYTHLVADIQGVLDTLIQKDLEVQSDDGRYYALRIMPYRTLDNVIEGVVITFVDISESVHTKKELARTALLLARTSDMAKVGGWELDIPSMKMTSSWQALLISEVDPHDDLTLEQLLKSIHPDDRATQKSAIDAAINNATPWDLELRLTTAKGQEIWVRSQGVSAQKDGKAIRIEGALQEITERKLIEEELRKANALLQAKG
jgi:two-component system CheB/CheR fusion protein